MPRNRIDLSPLIGGLVGGALMPDRPDAIQPANTQGLTPNVPQPMFPQVGYWDKVGAAMTGRDPYAAQNQWALHSGLNAQQYTYNKALQDQASALEITKAKELAMLEYFKANNLPYTPENVAAYNTAFSPMIPKLAGANSNAMFQHNTLAGREDELMNQTLQTPAGVAAYQQGAMDQWKAQGGVNALNQANAGRMTEETKWIGPKTEADIALAKLQGERMGWMPTTPGEALVNVLTGGNDTRYYNEPENLAMGKSGGLKTIRILPREPSGGLPDAINPNPRGWGGAPMLLPGQASSAPTLQMPQKPTSPAPRFMNGSTAPLATSFTPAPQDYRGLLSDIGGWFKKNLIDVKPRQQAAPTPAPQPILPTTPMPALEPPIVRAMPLLPMVVPPTTNYLNTPYNYNLHRGY